MTPKEYLSQMIKALTNGDQQKAKEFHHAYVETKSKDLLKEDHDKLLTSKGLEDLIKTLHTRAKKAKKEEAFLICLGKHSNTKDCTAKDFAKCAVALAKDKKKADQFVHDVEHELKMEDHDPAKDIEGKY
jgi:hypothetical protein